MAYTFNSRTQEAEAGGGGGILEFEAWSIEQVSE